MLKKYFKVSDLSNINKSNENHKPWLPKYFVKYIDIIIDTARPGLIIGKGGQEVEKLKLELSKVIKKEVGEKKKS